MTWFLYIAHHPLRCCRHSSSSITYSSLIHRLYQPLLLSLCLGGEGHSRRGGRGCVSLSAGWHRGWRRGRHAESSHGGTMHRFAIRSNIHHDGRGVWRGVHCLSVCLSVSLRVCLSVCLDHLVVHWGLIFGPTVCHSNANDDIIRLWCNIKITSK